MAKCFISFLGVSAYTPCNYCLGDGRINAVAFVQTALLHLKAADFTAADRILIGCTNRARETNLEPLRAEIAASGWRGPALADIALPDATSEQEMWAIFQRLMDQVRDGDELIFDITHSFRSLPMLFTVLIQYLRVVKHIKLRGVYYGAFERLGTAKEVQGMALAQRDVPVIDLTPFLSLYDWGAAIDHFLRFGHAGELQTLVDDGIKPVLKATGGQDDSAKALRQIVSNLAGFATNVRFARGQALSELRFQSRIVEPLQQVSSDFLPPLQPILDKLGERFRDWPDADAANGLRAVAWCIEHGMVQQGLTLLQETLVGILVERYTDALAPVGADKNDVKSRLVKQRTWMSQLLNVLGQQIPADGWRDELAEHRPIAEACAAHLPPPLPKLYAELTQLRNDINHAGFVNARAPDSLSRGLEDSYRLVCQALGAMPDAAPPAAATQTYFVSRHPGARAWAAEEGIVVDHVIEHLDPAIIQPGDSLIGSLPVNLAAAVCERGGRYLHLSLDLPAHLRGEELSAEQMRDCGARLECYAVERRHANDAE
jgi:putative CRISPR-associated protein (TIGR02620 family)